MLSDLGGALWGDPGGGAKGCDCTEPGPGAPGPGRVGVGNTRPCGGSSGTSSSSSGGGCGWPRGMFPGGRSGGSEKILPICARAGVAGEITVAATNAAKPVRTMSRNISRGFNGRIGLKPLYRVQL